MSIHTLASFRALLSAAVLTLASLSTAAHAQSTILKAKVPFGFENGSQHLPPGTYIIRLPASGPMEIRGNNGGGGFAMVTPDQNAKPATRSTVVFHRYGDRYFLRGVKVAGSSNSVHCLKSKAEKELQIARVESAPSDTEVALLELPR